MVSEISRNLDAPISGECGGVFFHHVAHLRFGNILGNAFDDFVLQTTIIRP